MGDDPQDSNDDIVQHEERKAQENRSDSPGFGAWPSGNNRDPMLVQDKLQNISPIQGKVSDKKRDSKDTVEDLKERLRQATAQLTDQQEEFKGQILHIETINMMTKYQLVFIKMEAALVKLANIMKTRGALSTSFAFSKINQVGKSVNIMKKLKTQLIFHTLKDNCEKLNRNLSTLVRGSLNRGFKSIWLTSRLAKAEKFFKDEKERYIKTFNEAISAKDVDLHQYKKKIEDLTQIVNNAKNKEQELSAKIKQKEKQIQTLEVEKAEILKSKKGGTGSDHTHEIRLLEEQIRELQAENEDLREKLYSAESNVGTFIKEMSDLLDSHELSTNIGSENNSFNNHDFEDDLDLTNKVKAKIGKESAGRNQPQKVAQGRYKA